MPAREDLIHIPTPVRSLIDRLDAAGYDCFIVGGYLRDLLLDRPTQDIDLASSATPEEAAELFSAYKVIPTGLAHGTLTILTEGQRVELTTFRREGAYSDHRHPDQVWFTDSIEADLSRRDFTINALAYHPARGLLDPWGGRQDLKRGLIRAVGDPRSRFREDALRILRAIRFRSELGFALEERTEAAAKATGHLLGHVAPERLRIELERLLCGEGAEDALLEFAEVIGVVIPEIKDLGRGEGSGPSRLEAAARRLGGVAPTPVKRFAALLYDSYLPATVLSAARRLRFSNDSVKQIERLVSSRTEEIEPETRSVWRALHLFGRTGFFDVLELRLADSRALAPEESDRLERIGGIAEGLIREGRDLTLAQLALDGHDLMELGYRGRAVGELLDWLLEKVCVEGIPNRREALLSQLELRAGEKPG